MKLYIPTKYEEQFIVWLIEQIQQIIILAYNPKNTLLHEAYINSKYKSLFKKYFLCKDIIISGVYNIVYIKYSDMYLIQINNNVNFQNTFIKLIDLCKLINYGVIGLRGYAIFSETFNAIKNNLDKYYNMYLERKD